MNTWEDTWGLTQLKDDALNMNAMGFASQSIQANARLVPNGCYESLCLFLFNAPEKLKNHKNHMDVNFHFLCLSPVWKMLRIRELFREHMRNKHKKWKFTSLWILWLWSFLGALKKHIQNHNNHYAQVWHWSVYFCDANPIAYMFSALSWSCVSHTWNQDIERNPNFKCDKCSYRVTSLKALKLNKTF